MARKPMVTRTFKTTNVEVMVFDTNTCEATNLTFTLPREVSDKAVALKKVKELHETEDLAIVKVVDIQVEENLYAMDEAFFIENATIVGKETVETVETTQA